MNSREFKQSKIENGIHFALFHKQKDQEQEVSFENTFLALKNDKTFRDYFIQTLKQIPFSAVRWETPPYSKHTLDRPFEFVVLEDLSLQRTPDSTPFEEFIGNTNESVLDFKNLGKDAHMVVPCQQDTSSDYCHLISFTNTAPQEQQHTLWQIVGELGLDLADENPLWLNTAGTGVAWLHVRFDNRPKYYLYKKYGLL